MTGNTKSEQKSCFFTVTRPGAVVTMVTVVTIRVCEHQHQQPYHHTANRVTQRVFTLLTQSPSCIAGSEYFHAYISCNISKLTLFTE